MIKELIQAAFLIFAAEMGDKSQIIAMAFVLQYSLGQVLAGVALGVFVNHGLAVALGAYLAHFVPLHIVRLAAAVGFLIFGLLGLMNGDEEADSKSFLRGHPILIVALTFFIGELGDKTQLTTIALASNADYPGAVLIGTVSGMVLTSLVGILVGAKLGERVPEAALRLASSLVFIGFGLFNLWQTLPPEVLTPTNVTVFLALLLGVMLYFIIPPIRLTRAAAELGEYGAMQRVAKELRRHLVAIEDAVEEICLGKNRCGGCRGRGCPVGYCKDLVRQALRENITVETFNGVPRARRSQHFDVAKIRHALSLIRQEHPDCEGIPEVETVIKRTEEVLRSLIREY